jgi:hypothetical protein
MVPSEVPPRFETDEKMAADLARPGSHQPEDLLILESKAEMQKRGQASTGGARWR